MLLVCFNGKTNNDGLLQNTVRGSNCVGSTQRRIDAKKSVFCAMRSVCQTLIQESMDLLLYVLLKRIVRKGFGHGGWNKTITFCPGQKTGLACHTCSTWAKPLNSAPPRGTLKLPYPAIPVFVSERDVVEGPTCMLKTKENGNFLDHRYRHKLCNIYI